MYTKPTVDDFLDAVSISLANDIMPELQSEKAQVAVAMMQTLLQCAKQIAHVEQQTLAQEHNEMVEVFRDVGAIIGETGGEPADRIRARARDLGGREEMPAIPDWQSLSSTYTELSAALVETLEDIDQLITSGSEAASEALVRVRQHLGTRAAREYGTYLVGAGMVGRG